RLVEQGYVGRIYTAHINIANGFGRSQAYQWRFDRSHGTGALGDLGCYAIDLARWFVGDIAGVSAHLATFVERPGPQGQPYVPANDSAVLNVGFENGAHGTIYASVVSHMADRGQHNHVALYGDAGSLELDATFSGGELRGVRADEERFATLPLPHDLDPTASSDVDRGPSVGDRAFIDAIVEDRPVSPSFYDGWRVQQVIDAAFASQEQGSWISTSTQG
ncbi:MAG: Gfo/Idh/MocA family oxidoreductase, partial [Chloroflexota bacterium]|nr:Gfo/Idh/MocA family oxidoreductase [Chloroflexota bacterium]